MELLYACAFEYLISDCIFVDQSLFKDYRSITNIRCSKAMRSVLVRCKRDEIAHVLKVLQRKFGYVVGAYYYPLSDGQNSVLYYVLFQSSGNETMKVFLMYCLH